MALLRKKNQDWYPSEQKDLKIGETIEVSDYRRLVESGDADLVDEDGTVLPLPGTIFVCAICYEKIGSHTDYVSHVMDKHATQTKLKKVVTEEEPEPIVQEEEKVKVPSSFGERMAAARAAAKAKREAARKAANG